MQSIGPYTLGEEIGRGAMGVVFRGFDPAIGRPVAIKLVRKSQFSSADEQAEAKLRFAREASAAGRLSHPNIVTVYQFGEQDDLEYLVQELVEGESLDKLLSGGQVQDPKVVISMLGQIADALDYAHGEGIVHRDVKPANILVRPDARAKITDFGIARISSQAVTKTGYSMGTLAYMAPEQIMTAKVSGSADQFSLAVVAFQMLSGKKPFVAETDPALIFKIVSEQPLRLNEVNPSLPLGASEVLLRGMAKNPDQRFPSCTEFLRELGAALSGDAPTVAMPASEAKPRESQPIARPGGRKYAGAAAGIVAVIAGAWGFWTLRQKAENPRPLAAQQQSQVPVPAVTHEAVPRIDSVAEPPLHKPPPSQPPVKQPGSVKKSPPAPEPPPINVAGNVQADMLLKQAPPEYPPLAKKAGVEGIVHFSAEIGRDGRIRDLAIVSGDPRLVEAARKAVEQWVYKPTLVNGKAVAVKTQIEVPFKLDHPADGRAYQALLDEGEQLLKDGKRIEAGEVGQKALQLDATRWEAYDLVARGFAIKRDAMSLGYSAAARRLAPKAMVPAIDKLIHRCETRLKSKGVDKDYEVVGKLTAINTELNEITVETDTHQSYVMKLSARTPVVVVRRGSADPPVAARKTLSALHRGDRVTVGIFGDLRALALIAEGS